MTPLEKCARAIAFRRAIEAGQPPIAALQIEKMMWESCMGQARACLEAIREPDEATSEAGNKSDYKSSEGCDINHLNSGIDGRPATATVFTAMIDYVLSQ